MIATHSIRVLGRELQVKSSASSEHVAQVEALVNEKLAEASAATTGADTQIVSILAMLNIAEAYLALKEEREEERRTNRERLTGLIERLEGQKN
ncbi:cell division protein ZapA [Geomonas limicola]|uniref:Cell division protein ZapA n=1 Tax=Geomonas limicola TaxID=2740186 RepID=A0A6V8NI43_9BACT|nr:cell division protein ZapA [Geomonas limicola]